MKTKPPNRYEIIVGREESGLTQSKAAEIIYSTLRTWQEWESGRRRMHPGLFELFMIKTGIRKVVIIKNKDEGNVE